MPPRFASRPWTRRFPLASGTRCALAWVGQIWVDKNPGYHHLRIYSHIIYIYIYIYIIYIYIYMCVYVYIYIYVCVCDYFWLFMIIYDYNQRERERYIYIYRFSAYQTWQWKIPHIYSWFSHTNLDFEAGEFPASHVWPVGTSPQVGEAFATALGAELSLKIQIVGVQANGEEMVHDGPLELGCRYPLVNIQKAIAWKDPPFLMGKSTISMAIFHCYVSSPEGTESCAKNARHRKW